MRFQTELVPARLIRRYKRFLADCVLEGCGTEITAHCPNPGSMMGLAAPQTRVWLEPNNDPKKKLRYGWRLVDHENGHFTGVDTSVPNRALGQALERGEIPTLDAYRTIRAEVKYAASSRIDFLLSQPGLCDLYLEIKSVTLCRSPGLAEFPDSVTARGTKHLGDLAAEVARGNRAMMLYLVQRTDCDRFSLAGDIDPAYARAFAAATDDGVEVMCLGTDITPQGVRIKGPLIIDI